METKHISLEEKSDVESEIISTIENKILDKRGFEEFMLKNGFSSGRRGNFESKLKGAFLYVKSCFLVNTKQEAIDSLLFLKYLTEKGILYPSTKWGIYETPTEQYQLFPVTRKLEVWTPEGQTKEGRDKLRRDGVGESSNYKELLSEGSHVLEWFRRIDPDFNETKEPSKNSLTEILNPFEASHSDNWGWGENGKLYPIDVETISLVNHSHEVCHVVEEWIKEHKV